VSGNALRLSHPPFKGTGNSRKADSIDCLINNDQVVVTSTMDSVVTMRAVRRSSFPDDARRSAPVPLEVGRLKLEK
jgi:hypothetical protein